MNRCNAMPEAISSGLVLQQRLSGATSSLSLGSKSGGWLLWHLMLCPSFSRHSSPLSSFHSPPSTRCADFSSFFCLFVWSVSSRASGATVATKEKIRRPRDAVSILNCEIFRLGSDVHRSGSVFRARPSSRIVQHHSFVFVWLSKGILQGA